MIYSWDITLSKILQSACSKPFQILEDFGNCDKKSKKWQEFLNDQIQNSLFYGPLCLNMSKNGFPAKTGLCQFVNNKIA